MIKTFKQFLAESITPVGYSDVVRYLNKLKDKYGFEIRLESPEQIAINVASHDPEVARKFANIIRPELKKRNWFISELGSAGGWLNIEPHGGKEFKISIFNRIFHLTSVNDVKRI